MNTSKSRLIDSLGDFVGGRLIFRHSGVNHPFYVIGTLDEYFAVGDTMLLTFTNASTSKRTITHLKGSPLTPVRDGALLVTSNATIERSYIQFAPALYCTAAVLHHPRRNASKTPS